MPTVRDLVRKTGADVIGHFDLITKFNEDGPFPPDIRGIGGMAVAASALLPYGIPFS